MKNLDRLTQLRKSRNLTQKYMANYLGISVRAYQHYEGKTREAPLTNADQLAKFFNVSLDYLIGESDNPKRH